MLLHEFLKMPVIQSGESNYEYHPPVAPTIWDLINSLSSKKYIIEGNEDIYSPFLVNRYMSLFPDCLLAANEINKCYTLPHKAQYDFYFFYLPKKKRFAKWLKKKPEEEHLELVSKSMNISLMAASEIIHLFTKDEIENMKKNQEIGGVQH